MMEFFKFFLLGILGLTLQMAWPSLRVDWLALAVGAAVLARGTRFALFLAGVLSLVYGGLSAEGPLLIFIPVAICIFLWAISPRWFSLDSSVQTFFLFLSISFGRSVAAFQMNSLGLDLAWAAVTAALGAWVLPVVVAMLRRQGRTLLRRRRRTGGLESLEHRRRALTRLEAPRGPFGLHKGA